MAKTLDLRHLSQADAATLIGKPTSWLRENAHLFERDQNGAYDGVQLVEAVTQSPLATASLKDSHTEALQQVLYSITNSEGQLGAFLRVIQELIDQHGETIGFAAMGRLVRDIAQDHARDYEKPLPTESEIRDRALREAEARIARLPEDRAWRELRTVVVCQYCDRYRWGRTWKKLPPPSGYIEGDNDCCPNCQTT